ncbi:MAG TPA: hypothetical protein VHB20_01875 [Verrucomicrobiae bacterium]|jgi:hypothetical protein|nr:hypothetical protein [Verrucomicrobiae bacterium]
MKKMRWAGLGVALGGIFLAALTGCVGYAGPGGGGVYVDAPDTFVFGGYHHGGFDREARHRGSYSRGFVHGGHGHR